MAAVAMSPLLPMWQHRLEAVLEVLRGAVRQAGGRALPHDA